MRVLVAGSSGFIGSALVSYLQEKGHLVTRLVRAKSSTHDKTLFWDPYGNTIGEGACEGFDAFVNLCGENISSGRWTAEKKRKIRDSRILTTRCLVNLISRLKKPPSVLINTSAVGYYGSKGAEKLTEEAKPGDDFLAHVCRDWEAEAHKAADWGVRVVTPRIGVVLGKEGGALKKMLLPFKLGLGGKIGSGEQYMSWIALQDLVKGLTFCLENESFKGAVNLVAPNPVTNASFTQALGSALKRPAILPMPAFAARLAFGEMADALLLSSTRAVPKKLQNSNFSYSFSVIEDAFKVIA